MSILLSVLSDASVDYLFRPHSLIQFFSIFFPFFFFFVVLLRFLFLFSSHTLPLFPLLFRSIPVKQADLSLSSLSLSLPLCLMYLLPPLFASLYYPRATPLSSLPSSSPLLSTMFLPISLLAALPLATVWAAPMCSLKPPALAIASASASAPSATPVGKSGSGSNTGSKHPW